MAQSGNGKHPGRLAPATVAACSTLESLWSEVDRIKADLNGIVEVTRPPNSLTAVEYSRRYKCGIRLSREQLDRMVQAGRLTKVFVALPNSVGAVVRTVCFIPVKPDSRSGV